jgi:hypothetical protein
MRKNFQKVPYRNLKGIPASQRMVIKIILFYELGSKKI